MRHKVAALDSVASAANGIQIEALNNLLHGDSNADLSQQPESTWLSGRFNLSADFPLDQTLRVNSRKALILLNKTLLLLLDQTRPLCINFNESTFNSPRATLV